MVHSAKRSRKSSKVSWAPGVELCQVKLFLSDDCPSQVGRYNLSMKTSGTRRSATVINDLPPGFVSCGKSKDESLSVIPQIRWKCPPTFIMNLNWYVTSGEESEEVVTQKLRENRVLEAVYPHRSSTPPNPLVSVDVSSEFYDDHQTTAVPVTPVEDQEIGGTSESVAEKDMQISQKPPPQGLLNLESAPVKLPGGGADIMAAISTALTAFLASNKQGSLVDTNLLVKILSDPKMVEQLVHNHGGGPTLSVHTSQSPASTVSHALSPEIALAPSWASNSVRVSLKVIQSVQTAAVFLPEPAPLSSSGEVDPSVHMSHRAWDGMCAPKTSHGNLVHPQLNQSQPRVSDNPPLQKSIETKQSSIWATGTTQKTDSVVAAVKVEPLKSLGYLKNLIREHGREGNENMENNGKLNGGHLNYGQSWKGVQNIKPGKMSIQTDKPCIYFKSSRGCRNGSSCPFLHGMAVEWRTGSVLEAPSGKKMRLGDQIAERIIL